MTMRLHFGTLLLSSVIAMVLWGMAHGTSSVERSVDIPIVFEDIPSSLVITDRSAHSVNIRVQGSRAAHRTLRADSLEYRIDVSEARPGPAVYEIDAADVDEDLPRGLRIVSRSPASVEMSLAPRGRKSLVIRPDLSGDPAEGFSVTRVQVEPSQVWVTGARSASLGTVAECPGHPPGW